LIAVFAAKAAVNKLAHGFRLARRPNSAFMDSCQLIRKETKMDVVHLNQKQLAARWHLSEANGRLEVTGVEEPDKVQNDFLAVLRGGQKLNRVIRVTPHRFELEGKHVFAFHIPEMPRLEKPVYLKGDPRQSYLRRGAGDEQFTQSELERFLRDAAQERYDGAVLTEFAADACFDLDTVKWYQAQFARRNPEHAPVRACCCLARAVLFARFCPGRCWTISVSTRLLTNGLLSSVGMIAMCSRRTSFRPGRAWAYPTTVEERQGAQGF
jgi:hypothetical protein